MNNIGRDFILNNIHIDGKLNHFAANKRWYVENNLEWLYDSIIDHTRFLNEHAVTLRERIYYIEQNINEIRLCDYCKCKKLKYKSNIVCFTKTCGDWECRKKHQSKISHEMWTNYNPITLIERNKKISKKMCGREISLETRERLRNRPVRKQSEEEKRKRVATRKKNNPVWHLEETKLKIKNSNKIIHNSEEFKRKYVNVHNEAHKKISNTIKRKILNNEFTPNITNSWTRWTAYVNIGSTTKRFRSSWEAVFWLLNTDLKYEDIRIQYEIDDSIHAYIVDFHDPQNKRLYEIKPSSLVENINNTSKFDAAIEWCKQHDYEFVVIDEKWFIENAKFIDYDQQPQLLKPMSKFL